MQLSPLGSESSQAPADLDAHATTPLAREAEAAMAPFWREQAANPHSSHYRGLVASAAVDRARQQVAELIDASPSELCFTSGATEANAIALLGMADAATLAGDARRRIVISAIEHRSVEACASELARRHWDVRVCPVQRDGLLDLDALDELVTADTLLVSIIAASNEIGVLQPLGEIAVIARRAGASVHADASQMAGRLPFSFLDLDLDLVSLSSHKLHGPMGVGALLISADARLRPRPLMFGGGQEAGLRPGTVPTPLAIGFGAAAALARSRRDVDAPHLRQLARRMVDGLSRCGVPVTLNGSDEHRLPGSLSLRVGDADADDILARCSGEFCASTGSACSSGQIQPSKVLKAIGLSRDEARSSVRFGFTRYTTNEEVDRAIRAISAAYASRSLDLDHPSSSMSL